MRNSGRPVVIAVVVLAVLTLVTTIIRERNKKTMFALYEDVHDLAEAQSAYFSAHSSYSPMYPNGYIPAHGTAVAITAASDTSWAATATHAATGKVCSITFAQPRNATPAQVEEARIAAWKGYSCK